MKRIGIAALCLLLLLPQIGCGEKTSAPKDGVYVVGKHIKAEQITEFYYTVATSTFPPHYQRYRFFKEDGAYRFFHETREGDHFPLTEADATATGTVTLTAEQWEQFLACIDGGTVIARQEHLEDGDAGPWLYLYWDGDPGDVQEFAFWTLQSRADFETFCEHLIG